MVEEARKKALPLCTKVMSKVISEGWRIMMELDPLAMELEKLEGELWEKRIIVEEVRDTLNVVRRILGVIADVLKERIKRYDLRVLVVSDP